MNEIKLGEKARYSEKYEPTLLQPIPRSEARQNLSARAPAFKGVDLWTAYELSWLTRSGKPAVALLELEFPADSENIIESKSLKYYLNSFCQHQVDSIDALRDCLVEDLSLCAGSAVSVEIRPLSSLQMSDSLPGNCVDSIELSADCYQPDANLLQYSSENVHAACLISHLLKTNCPVTGQPDWASVWIRYSGRKLEEASFLRYVISYRRHQDFHENCVEKIFCDLQARGALDSLEVYARYLRRGGLDINPYRASLNVPDTEFEKLRHVRLIRQ